MLTPPDRRRLPARLHGQRARGRAAAGAVELARHRPRPVGSPDRRLRRPVPGAALRHARARRLGRAGRPLHDRSPRPRRVRADGSRRLRARARLRRVDRRPDGALAGASTPPIASTAWCWPTPRRASVRSRSGTSGCGSPPATAWARWPTRRWTAGSPAGVSRRRARRGGAHPGDVPARAGRGLPRLLRGAARRRPATGGCAGARPVAGRDRHPRRRDAARRRRVAGRGHRRGRAGGARRGSPRQPRAGRGVQPAPSVSSCRRERRRPAASAWSRRPAPACACSSGSAGTAAGARRPCCSRCRCRAAADRRACRA